MMKIKHLSRNEIDSESWDQIIKSSPQGFPYAYSWYLDCAAQGRWNALITDNYQYIMPLVWNKKLLGIKQIYQPLLSQQLGVFGTDVNSEIINLFIQAIPSEYKYIQMCLPDDSNKLEKDAAKVIKKRTNLIIELNKPYEEIRTNYSKILKRRIKNAQEINQLQKANDVKGLVAFYKRAMNQKLQLKEKDYTIIEKLFHEIIERRSGSIYAVKDNHSDIVCMGMFIETDKRVINVFGASNERGKEINSMHFMIDQVIRMHVGQKKIFDFEGSDLKGVSDFFRSFGSREENYIEYVKDRLPLWGKMLKHKTLLP